MTYNSAYEELQSILMELENDSIKIDDLPKKVKRAGELLRFCKEKLRNSEVEVMNLMNVE